MHSDEELKKIAGELRIAVIDMIHKAGSGHSGGSLSCAEILIVLYDRFLRVRPTEPDWADRDRFILSKGHGAPMLYAVLAREGFFDAGLLDTLRQINSPLQGHPCMFRLPGIDMSTGSLGMGISVGVGMALSAKLTGKDFRVFVLCGDGELQEGQNWEGLMSASKWGLDNLILLVDRNHVQLDGTEYQVMPLGDLTSKLEAFGIHTLECDGHDIESLSDSIRAAIEDKGPAAVIAETVKGKDVSFMEGQAAWHGKQIGEAEYARAIRELREGLAGWRTNR